MRLALTLVKLTSLGYSEGMSPAQAYGETSKPSFYHTIRKGAASVWLGMNGRGGVVYGARALGSG